MTHLRTALLLLSLAGARVAALTVTSTPLAPPADILGEHQELQRLWTVADVDPLRDLRLLRVPGAVYIDLEPESPASDAGQGVGSGSGSFIDAGSEAGSEDQGSQDAANASSIDIPVSSERVVARIVVSGSSEPLMESVQVLAHEDAGVALTLSADSKHHSGHLLTQIFVADYRALEGLHVESASSSSVVVVVGSGVMPATFNLKPVAVKATSSGNASLFFDDEQGVAVSALDVSATFSAAVQVAARGPLSVATSLDLASFGSGDIAVVAQSVSSKRVVTTVGGSGDVYVQTSANESGIETQRIDTRVAGSGSVTLSRSGHCQHQDIVLLGSGDVEAGSVLCGKTDVMLIGSGDVVVQTAHELHATIFASGRVAYVGRRPETIVERGFFFGHPKVEHATDGENAYHTYQVQPEPPTREAALVGGDSSEEGDVSMMMASTFSAFSKSNSGDQVVAGLAVVAVCGAVVAAVLAVAMVAHFAYRRRQRRHQYTRLV